MSKTIIIACGNPDAEMAAVERLGGDAGCVVVHAYHNGRRVHAGNAYSADAIFLPDGTPYTIPDGATVLRVECDGPAFADIPAERIIVCDHHRPGDPGYGRPPEEFLAASSVGQVVAELARVGWRFQSPTPTGGVTGWTTCSGPIGALGELRYESSAADPFGDLRPRRASRWHVLRDASTSKFVQTGETLSPDERRMEATGYVHTVSRTTAAAIPADIVLVAAADHCLEAAYRGRCPGADPDDLMRWRAESRAEFQRRPVEAVLADIAAARERLLRAIDRSTEYADLRGVSIPELPEAAAREGIPFLADQTDRDGRRKVVLMAAPPDLVQRFMAGEIVPGLTGYYGDPARGFAGGYVQ